MNIESGEKEVLLRLRLATGSFPADMVDRWAKGKSPREIAEETGTPLKTVFQILKTLRKAIAQQIARGQIELVPERPGLESSRTLGDDDSTKLDPEHLQCARADRLESEAQEKYKAAQYLSLLLQLDAGELEKLVPQVIALGAARRAPHLEHEESKLLARVNKAIPSRMKSRLLELQKKRDARSLTEPEFEELIALSDRVEQLHSERLDALADLAKLRRSTLPALMHQLGIRFPDNA